MHLLLLDCTDHTNLTGFFCEEGTPGSKIDASDSAAVAVSSKEEGAGSKEDAAGSKDSATGLFTTFSSWKFWNVSSISYRI